MRVNDKKEMTKYRELYPLKEVVWLILSTPYQNKQLKDMKKKLWGSIKEILKDIQDF